MTDCRYPYRNSSVKAQPLQDENCWPDLHLSSSGLRLPDSDPRDQSNITAGVYEWRLAACMLLMGSVSRRTCPTSKGTVLLMVVLIPGQKNPHLNPQPSGLWFRGFGPLCCIPMGSRHVHIAPPAAWLRGKLIHRFAHTRRWGDRVDKGDVA